MHPSLLPLYQALDNLTSHPVLAGLPELGLLQDALDNLSKACPSEKVDTTTIVSTTRFWSFLLVNHIQLPARELAQWRMMPLGIYTHKNSLFPPANSGVTNGLVCYILCQDGQVAHVQLSNLNLELYNDKPVKAPSERILKERAEQKHKQDFLASIA